MNNKQLREALKINGLTGVYAVEGFDLDRLLELAQNYAILMDFIKPLGSKVFSEEDLSRVWKDQEDIIQNIRDRVCDGATSLEVVDTLRFRHRVTARAASIVALCPSAASARE